jgi:bisphosphoglycerate-independent phosphoglycerate mutase (AlkP superfamily)
MSGSALVVPNLSAWTGGHEGPYLVSDVPGIVVIHSPGSAPVDVRGAGLQDIAPTVLRLLGIAGPPGITGRSLV